MATPVTTPSAEPAGAPDFLSGGGQMGERMRALDWAATPLGPSEAWPQSLRSAVSICIGSRFPIVLYWGPQRVVLYNDAYAEILGGKHPWALGRPCREVWSEIWEVIAPMLDGVGATGQATWSEDQLLVLERRGYAEECYFSFSFSPVRGEDGQVEGIFTAVIESTGRVLGERRLALLTELAAHPAARTPREACEQAVRTLAGKPDVPFALTYLKSQVGEQLVASTPGADAALAAAAPQHAVELPIPGGRLVIGANPRRSLDEQQLAFLNLVAGQLATAIANAQAYEEERKRAEALAELDRVKTAFFSNVSHEFRTPLTLLLGPITELLSRSGRPDEERATLELIERNALRLQKLVNTLLDFSRIEAGRMHAQFAPANIAELTADLASAFRSVIEGAGLTLRVECENPVGPVYVDREMWEKVVLNLLSNAFKHTFEGEITVRVRGADGSAVLTIADTGVGIPPGQLERVFDRFHQVPSSKSRTHEGSGIGLSLVRELVHLHGGTVGVTSAPGTGTTFEVRIPLGFAHLPVEHVGHDAAAVGRHETTRVVAPFVREASSWSAGDGVVSPEVDAGRRSAVLGGAHVVVVDDNADMRQYVSRILTEAGARVSVAPDGAAALRILGDHTPDVILSDVMMPVLDGFGLLAAVRADDRLRTTPFVMLSARAGEESRIGGLAAGADDYLVKPFAARELIARVAAQRRLARANAAERLARAEADEARGELSRIFEQAPVPICVIEGQDLLYTTANASYRQIIGGRDPVGKRLLELWPELWGSDIHRVFQQVLTTGQPYVATEFGVQFDQFGRGELREAFFNFVYHPLKGASGATRGIIAVATDVTPQVLARAEADRLRKAAESANEAKLHLLRTVSHETRQPVHASLGYLELLALGIRGPLTDHQRSDLENIRKNQTHLLRLLNDILSFAKLEAGALELELTEADASEILEQLTPLVAPQFSAKGVRYIAHPPTSRAAFRGDRERTVQVCVNLLTNALKATPAGGTVTVGCAVTDATVSLSVSDTGMGIPRAKLEEIFDPFTQLGRPRASNDARGFGLGLSISRQLARAMKGDVTVESTEGAGSTFTFTLPRSSPAR
jgi:signal transduction histidine kinase